MGKFLKRIGQSLMIPIAVLPAASILMGIGYWLDPGSMGQAADTAMWATQASSFCLKVGGALIDNMGILFAIGVAFGMSKDKHGAAALTALVGWLITQSLFDPNNFAAIANMPIENVPAAFGHINNQFIGILIGVIAAFVYDHTYQVELPKALSFFSGRRLSAIVMSGATIILFVILTFLWPTLYGLLVSFGEHIVSLGAVGAGIFGFANRLLIPTGLHHALNSVFWFDVAGINDIPNFLAGTGTPGVTGMYQAGFFPIMMFGLPAAALAIYHEALPKHKAFVGGVMLAGAISSIFTGVTEPLEFSFMFVAPFLYVIHAVLTGISMFIAAQFQFMSGFGFSAGLLDYVFSFKNPLAINHLMLLVQGICFAFIYYFTFRFSIRKFNIMTPGRDENESTGQTLPHPEMAKKILDIIGQENLEYVDNCTTRLRLDVKDSSKIDEKAIKDLGISGVIKPSKTSIQIIVGPDVQFVSDELKKINK
ncbi:MAG: N-acetylglucosamine-specific PTS transporter subunit IIBC [Mycoplasmatales bacterium]